MAGAQSTHRPALAPAKTLSWALGVIPVLAVVVVLAGLGMVALGDDLTWNRWSSVGEAFGVVNSVVSALAVAALVVTWLLQSRDLRAQTAALSRQAELDARRMHVDLIRMALERRSLAAVWPAHSGIDAARQEQYMYANLLLQHVWMLYRNDMMSPEETVNYLRFLFASPVVRQFWRDTTDTRVSLHAEGGSDVGLASVADKICREYEEILACAGERPHSRDWPTEDLQTGGWPGATAGPSPPQAEFPE